MPSRFGCGGGGAGRRDRSSVDRPVKEEVEMVVNRTAIVEAARQLGINGKPVCVHISLRSFPKLEKEAETLIEGLLDAGVTVMVATMANHAFSIPAPPSSCAVTPFTVNSFRCLVARTALRLTGPSRCLRALCDDPPTVLFSLRY